MPRHRKTHPKLQKSLPPREDLVLRRNHAAMEYRVTPFTPHPFNGRWLHYPVSIRERAMLWFVNKFTDIPNWPDLINDSEATEAWLSQLPEDGRLPRLCAGLGKRSSLSMVLASLPTGLAAGGFSRAMGDFCVEELRDKAATIAQQGYGIVRVMDCDAAVFKLDKDGAFNRKVKVAMAPLEKGSHSPGQPTVSVVDPEEYPLTYGLTRVTGHPLVTLGNCLESIGTGEVLGTATGKAEIRARLQNTSDEGRGGSNHFNQHPYKLIDANLASFVSDRYAYLATDVEIKRGGCRLMGYLNNVHPSNTGAYRVIEELLNTALPAFMSAIDTVQTTQLRRPLDDREMNLTQRPRRIAWPKQPSELFACRSPAVCATMPWKQCLVARTVKRGTLDDDCDCAPSTLEQRDTFDRNHGFAAPEPGVLSTTEYPLRCPWKRLQIIVRVTEHLVTPEAPRHPGTEWGVEGLLNEHIVAVGAYFYALENVSEPQLAFRAPRCNRNYFPDDPRRAGGSRIASRDDSEVRDAALDAVYGPDKRGLLRLGSVAARPGRMVVWPNVLQHRLEPFALVDKTRPGCCKSISILLVEPELDILSTSYVPPQQGAWAHTGDGIGWALRRLPVEISDMILNYYDDCPFDHNLACAIKQDMQEERNGRRRLTDPDPRASYWVSAGRKRRNVGGYALRKDSDSALYQR